MAKGKQTISDIQKALLSNTKFIKEEEKPLENEARQEEVKSKEPQVAIEPLVLKKFNILAEYEGETLDALINKALNHYLRLKSLQLDDAIRKITKE